MSVILYVTGSCFHLLYSAMATTAAKNVDLTLIPNINTIKTNVNKIQQLFTLNNERKHSDDWTMSSKVEKFTRIRILAS